jgi:hypothetical protein
MRSDDRVRMQARARGGELPSGVIERQVVRSPVS